MIKKKQHSATGMTPMQAREPKNQMKVKLHLELKRKSTRKYPDIVIGNKVKNLHEKKPVRERTCSSMV